MMQALRNNTKPIFLITIFAFVVGFVFLEGQAMLGGGLGRDPNVIAVVNGTTIPYQAYAQQFAAAQAQAGGDGTLSNRVRVDLERSAFEELISLTMLQQAAEARGLGTDLEEVLEFLRRQPPDEVRQSPIFLTNGQFDMSSYYRALANEPFLQQMSNFYLQQLPIIKLNDMLSSAAKTSAGEAVETADSRAQRATVSYIRVTPSLFGPDPASFSTEEVEAYYRENASAYAPKETAVITYANLKRRASSLDTLEVSEVVESIFFEVEAGESFDELLDIHSDSPRTMRGGSIGTFIDDRSPQMTPEMRAVLDTLEVGEHTSPFADTYGYHIVLLDSTRTTPEGDTTYRIKDIQLRVTVSGTTDRDLEQRMIAFRADVEKRKGDIHAVADTSAAIVAFTTEPFDIANEPAFIDANLPVFDELVEFCRNSAPASLGPIVEGPGGYFLWRLDRRGPGSPRPLEEIEPRVRADMVRERGAEDARQRAAEIARRALNGETLEALAESDSLLRVDTSRPFSRAAAIDGIGKEPGIMGTAFAMEIGAIAGPIEGRDEIQYVIRLDERTDPARGVSGEGALPPQAVEAAVGELQNLKRDLILVEFRDDLRRNAKIKDLRPVRAGTL